MFEEWIANIYGIIESNKAEGIVSPPETTKKKKSAKAVGELFLVKKKEAAAAIEKVVKPKVPLHHTVEYLKKRQTNKKIQSGRQWKRS